MALRKGLTRVSCAGTRTATGMPAGFRWTRGPLRSVASAVRLLSEDRVGASRTAVGLLSGLFLLPPLVSVGCYLNDGISLESPTPTVTPAPQTFQLETLSTPVVYFDPITGKTRVMVHIISRDEEGIPIDPERLSARLLLDGEPVDKESILTSDSADLSFDILFGLALDSSYSMLVQDPPAFEPMLMAARDSVEEGQAIWKKEGGSFSWELAWFNEHVCAPRGTWATDDILTIPSPAEGTATRLFGAVSWLSQRMALRWQEGIASRSFDYHVMLVLSDGADNISWFDNATQYTSAATSSGAEFGCYGTASTELSDALESISAHPNLTVHVAGLGSDINSLELQQMAISGDGLYLVNPSSSAVESLFERITQEFFSIRVEGAEMPLRPGDYVFTIQVSGAEPRGSGALSFGFHAGDSNAGVLAGN